MFDASSKSLEIPVRRITVTPQSSTKGIPVAQKVQVILLDDLDGGAAVETVSFSVDGTAYEIDLSAKNAAALRDDFAKWVGSARRAGRGGAPRAARGRSTTTADREQTQAIRAWARKKGLQVSERGRIPAGVIEQYNAAR
jgi:hypothetical protein